MGQRSGTPRIAGIPVRGTNRIVMKYTKIVRNILGCRAKPSKTNQTYRHDKAATIVFL
jgi:hypothetical protein